MNRPVHFELHVADPARSIAFYKKVFGWKFNRWEGGADEYYLVNTGEGDGISGGLMKSRDGQPRTVNTVQVANVDEYARKVAAAGGQIVMPTFAIPGVGWIAYATDPGGNLFGIYHDDPGAK
jgi:hypothetical protein